MRQRMLLSALAVAALSRSDSFTVSAPPDEEQPREAMPPKPARVVQSPADAVARPRNGAREMERRRRQMAKKAALASRVQP